MTQNFALEPDEPERGYVLATTTEAAARAAMGATAAFREGFAAFQQKRPPKFSGR